MVVSSVLRMIVAVVIAGASLLIVSRPAIAPIPGFAGLLWGAVPLVRAWRGTRGTALRPTVVWAAITIAIAAVSQIIAMGEPFETGRPVSGQVAYLSTLAAFATLISVLNARRPGGGAWAILMTMLMVVFLIPWLEGSELVREGDGWDRLRLTAPWTIFYGLLVIAGVTNFVPTRFFSSSIFVALGFGIEYLGVTRPEWSHEIRGRLWLAVPLCWAAAAWCADLDSLRPSTAAPGLGRLWAWFRNGWGVVWALRVQERFNRAAEFAGWSIRLSWHGVVNASGSRFDPVEIPPEAKATLAGLLRRFATSEVIDRASGDEP